MFRRLLSVLAITLAVHAAPSAAQTSPGATPSAATETGDLHGLIEALKDEATRSRLIEALEDSVLSEISGTTQSNESPPPAAESTGRAHLPSIPGVTLPNGVTPEASTTGAVPGPSIGDRVIEAAPNIAREFVEDLTTDWDTLRLNISRLGGLTRSGFGGKQRGQIVRPGLGLQGYRGRFGVDQRTRRWPGS